MLRRPEEKDTFRMKLEKRTLFASQQEEASESLRYSESESKSENKETHERTEEAARCDRAVNVAANGQVTEDIVINDGAASDAVTNENVTDEAVTDDTTMNMELRLGYVGLQDQEVPEADKLLEVVGQIDGRPA